MYRQQQQHSSARALAPNCLLSTTRAGRSALNSNQAPAASPTAEGPHVCRHCKQDHPASECHPVFKVKGKLFGQGNRKSAVDKVSVVNDYLTTKVALGGKWLIQPAAILHTCWVTNGRSYQEMLGLCQVLHHA